MSDAVSETDETAERDNRINEYLINTEVAQPKVVPPRETRSKLYTDPAIFAEFDKHALKVCVSSLKILQVF